MSLLDPHSYNDAAQPEVAHLDWKARIDFDRRMIDAVATLRFRSPGSGPLDLDTRELTIKSVDAGEGRSVAWELAPSHPVLGARLRLNLPAETREVRIHYVTSENASALQWLEPAQTAGGKHPYLFSQCQAIHARSVVPLQDTPRIRITWSAELEIPRELRAVMAARTVDRREDGARAFERFEMPQPIPPYLFALAVGDLASRELGPRSRVWAEPAMVEKAAAEFSDTDAMLTAAERLFGSYDWERFDLLVMPPSFPYGGMENPRLTFLTPTVIAGDKSLVNVVAHELAHSWTGNLVTNSNAEHFWLNEGFTVYAERRIQEVLEGTDMAALHTALGRRSLESAIEGFEDRPELTRLRTHLKGVDPDDAYSQVPYEKGFLFLLALEQAAGRDAFDAFLKRYIETFRFQSITTDQFLELARREIPAALDKVGANAWIDGEGIPANAPRARSTRLEEVEALGAKPPSDEQARRWTPTEWQLYLESMPRPAPRDVCDAIDRGGRLSKSTNMEMLVSWLELAIDSDLDVTARTEEVLGSVGRMKYLKPLYTALAKRDDTRADARRIFNRFAQRYHPIARQVVEGVLKKNGA